MDAGNSLSLRWNQPDCSVTLRVQFHGDDLARLPLHIDGRASADVDSLDGTIGPLFGQGWKEFDLNGIRHPTRLNQGFQHSVCRAEVAVDLEDTRRMRIHQVGKCGL